MREELTFPCTLIEVRRYWRISQTTFYRWLAELRDEHPGIQWYGKRGRHTRVTAQQYHRLEAAIWGEVSPYQEPERATKRGSFEVGLRAANTRSARWRETREVRDAALRRLSLDTPEPPGPRRPPFRRFPK